MMAPSSTENRNSKTKLLFHSLLFSKVNQRENQRGEENTKNVIIYSIENEMKNALHYYQNQLLLMSLEMFQKRTTE